MEAKVSSFLTLLKSSGYEKKKKSFSQVGSLPSSFL
jgi:hypothetical protein